MTPITSPHNTRLKELRKLARAAHRARTGLFAAEGEDLVAAAAQVGRQAVEGFRAAPASRRPVEGVRAVRPGRQAAERVRAAQPDVAGAPPLVPAWQEGFHEVEATALAAVSTLGSGTRVIGVYEQRWGDPVGPLCVYLHGVGDPGNVGTVLRSALAFGASCVALGPGCADPHSPKAVRASMGAIFSVTLARVTDVAQLPGERIALVAHAGQPLFQLALKLAQALPELPSRDERSQAGAGKSTEYVAGRTPVTLLVGAEREGLPEDVVAACEHVAHIPISSESLNAAMAATVALYEMTHPSTRVSTS